jgi:hypothetical protein
MNCYTKRLECVQLVHPPQFCYGGRAGAVVRRGAIRKREQAPRTPNASRSSVAALLHPQSGAIGAKPVRVNAEWGLEGVRTTPAIQIPSGGGCPWQARKNRLASAAGKQDDSGMHHATAANGNQDLSAAPALLAGPGAMEDAVSQLRNYDPFPATGSFRHEHHHGAQP